MRRGFWLVENFTVVTHFDWSLSETVFKITPGCQFQILEKNTPVTLWRTGDTPTTDDTDT